MARAASITVAPGAFTGPRAEARQAMSAVRNILFIMCDQLRADHLGCYGHPFLATAHLDELARRGVRFDATAARVR